MPPMPSIHRPPEGAPDAGLPDGRPSAIALSYADKNRPPLVVAKGYGDVANAIVLCARENGLYVHASSELVGLLMQVRLDDEIPPQLYQVIAEVLAWLYGLETLHSTPLSA